MTRHRSSPAKRLAARAKKQAGSMMKSVLAMSFFQQIIEMHEMDEAALNLALLSYGERREVSAARKDGAANRRYRQRRSWDRFQGDLTERQFRRYFRMSRECFRHLCNRIESNVGERAFKSEEYLQQLKYSTDKRDQQTIGFMQAHENTTGGFVSGEVKLALTLRLLAGGSYLDLSLLYEVSSSYAYEIFHNVVKDWILDDRLVKISGTDYVNDEDRLKEVALEFARSSGGLFNGCIGAIDGWIVKIRKPTLNDNVTNPGSFYSRKGYFGLNVVAIVDRKKRVLYRVIQSRGAEHDSTAFKHSKLYKWLMENWISLRQKGYYFIGDSAYSLKSFLLTPFDNVLHGTPEDDFNFFHSSERICVECAFGEIDLRWGILWRPLQFTLAHNIKVIDACMRLHNFIVDFREEHEEGVSKISALDKDIFDEDCRRFMAAQSAGATVGVAGGEDDIRLDADGLPVAGGRPTSAEAQTSSEGKSLRERLKGFVQSQQCVRPPSNFYRDNNRFFER